MRLILFISFFALSISAFGATSPENRANKKVELTYQLGGDYRMATTQVAAMYFIDSNRLVGLKAGSQNGNNEQQTSVAIQYKQYTTDSFYLAGEAFYLNTREDINGVWGDVFQTHDYAEYKSLGMGIRIGNQWTWDYFTLGCDWIGVGNRVIRFQRDTSKTSDLTITVLNIIAGISF